MRYKNEGHKKINGIVYTPSQMADYLSENIVRYKKQINDSKIKILDPAIGEGELVISLLKTISENSNIKSVEVYGFETDESIIIHTQNRIKKAYPDAMVTIYNKDFLLYMSDEEIEKEKFDFIIANPPYIRTQILGTEKSQSISKELGLSGRVDIYYAFLIYANSLLKEDGVAGFITSNKFMSIKAGSTVRKYLLMNSTIHRITDFGDTKLFSAAVLPCIIIFSRGMTEEAGLVDFTSIYETQATSDDDNIINNIFEKIEDSCVTKLVDGRCFEIKQGSLSNANLGAPWTISSSNSGEWIKKVESSTWLRFSDIGKIRVGIKTTADNVFIGDNWPDDDTCPELLAPLITHRNAGQIINGNEKTWRVLYPYTSRKGKRECLNIEEYPNSLKYLMQHKEQLEGREYLKKANRKWYEIWVPQNPDSWKDRKIIFRDISEQPQFWLDRSGAVVNGDCYWIDIYDTIFEETVLLALAVANSPFIEKFYDHKFNTKLYSGKRRYMTQYVENFPIPYPDSDLAKTAVEMVKEIITGTSSVEHTRKLKQEIDKIINTIFS